MRSLILCCLLLLGTIAHPCMWDYDTFAVEASGKNDIVAVLAGRFERNPPLYYEMRLARCLERLKTEPQNLDLYDNAAVAYERLGQSEKAIEMIHRKKAQMKALPQDKDHWYRYYANLGTFHAHIGMKAKGAQRVALLKGAESEIRKAIDINPHAHFGREKYQFYAIQWLLADTGFGLWDYLRAEDKNTEGGVLGLSGLIRLGAAWESIDIWWALAEALQDQRDRSLAYFAIARIEELEKAGRTAFVAQGKGSDGKVETYSEMAKQAVGWQPTDEIQKQNTTIYADLRRQADEWHQNRTTYIIERLKQGRHPDWDKEFWSEWRDEPKLDVPTVGLMDRISAPTRMLIAAVALLTVLFLSLLGLVLLLIKRAKAAKAKLLADRAFEQARRATPHSDWEN